MKKYILILLLLSFSNTRGQEKNIVLADLFGSWTFDHKTRDENFDITVYKSCADNSKTTIYRFYTNGNFEILYNYQLTRNRGPRRCGNEINIKPKNVKGTYLFNEKHQQLQFKSQSHKSSWNLIWIDKNSFAIKKVRPKQNKV